MYNSLVLSTSSVILIILELSKYPCTHCISFQSLFTPLHGTAPHYSVCLRRLTAFASHVLQSYNVACSWLAYFTMLYYILHAEDGSQFPSFLRPNNTLFHVCSIYCVSLQPLVGTSLILFPDYCG